MGQLVAAYPAPRRATARVASPRVRTPVAALVAAPSRLPYRPELDGIRALAVLAVMVFHAKPLFPRTFRYHGGFMGVDVFFALSGFLITTLLLQEHASFGRISLPKFYLRRALRLLPALGLTVAVGAVVAVHIGGNDSTRSFAESALVAFTFLGNWFHSVESLGLMGHTWSLAVEEQFYLLWPLVLVIAMRSGRSPRALARTLVLSAIVIVAVRYALYFDGRFEAASFWSVARGDGIFYGSALALVIADRTSLIARTLRFSAVGVFGAVMLLGITVGCRPGVSATWCGTPAASVGATILIGHLVMNRDGLLAMLLALRPLPAIGRMSYGLYLFHWPVTVWMYQWTNPTSGAAAVTMFAVTFAIAIASYHLLERPFMRLYGRITAPRAEVIELQKKTKPADHRRLVAAG